MEEDVVKMTTPWFLEQLKQESMGKSRVFIEIPPGANNIHRDFPEGLEKGPVIHYKQREGE